jgi:hypothetical protein
MLASFIVLVCGMLGVGWWIGRQIQHGVIHRTAATTALYVDSFVAPYLQDLARAETLQPEQVAGLHSLLRHTPLGQHIVAFKIWDARGYVVYSTDATIIGQHFPLHGDRARAWRGEVVAAISTLQEAEHYVENQNGHLGLVGMRERVESLGGRFQIEAGPGQGTAVIAQVPLTTREGEDYE